MKDLCLKCNDRTKCTKLCEKAKLYVDQDHIKRSKYIAYESELYPTNLDFLANACLLTHQEMVNSDIEVGNRELTILKSCNLTDRQFECMYLYYWKRKNQYKIAEELGIGQPRVMTHLKRARKKLLKLLKNID